MHFPKRTNFNFLICMQGKKTERYKAGKLRKLIKNFVN